VATKEKMPADAIDAWLTYLASPARAHVRDRVNAMMNDGGNDAPKSDNCCGKGTKFDEGKLRYGLLPSLALREVAAILTLGAETYGPDNWRELDNLQSRFIDAAMRHIEEYRRGLVIDPASGMHHLAHAVCSLMFVVEHELRDDASEDEKLWEFENRYGHGMALAKSRKVEP
jgi:hypothetical protein